MDIINFKEIESTSVWARKNLSDLNDFQVVSADVQSMGHGQFERSWYSSDKNGGNIYISIVLKPENIEHLNELTRFTSYIGAKTIEKYGIKAQFKFPNDILINGINLNLNKEEVKNIDIPATSIFIETGNNIDKSEFLEKLLHNFKKEYDEFLKNGMNEEARGLLKV